MSSDGIGPMRHDGHARTSRFALIYFITVLKKTWAFIQRDYQTEASYKVDFLLRALNSLVPLVFFFFLSKLVASDGTTGLGRYGGEYFPFVFVGIAFHRYLQLSLRWFADSIYLAQVTGSLEAMLASQTRPTTIILMSSIYGLISSSVQLALILAVAVLSGHIDLSQADFAAASIVLVLSILTFVGFGVVSATSIILFKRGDPVTFLFSTVGIVVGGAYFPIEVLPVWLQNVAWFIPITHSLHALRLTLLQGYSLPMVIEPVLILGSMGLVLFPLSLKMFSLAVLKGRRDGTLMQY